MHIKVRSVPLLMIALSYSGSTYAYRLITCDSVKSGLRCGATPIKWVKSTVNYYVSSSGSGLSEQLVATAVANSFAAWANTGIPLRFNRVTSSSDADVKIFWDVLGTTVGQSATTTDDQNAFGRTTLEIDTDTGEIQRMSIALNATRTARVFVWDAPLECWGALKVVNPAGIPLVWNIGRQGFDGPLNNSFLWADVQATVTHEIGHVLGLNHSTVDGAAMSTVSVTPAIFCSTTQQVLKADDIAGIRAIYGATLVTGRVVWGTTPIPGAGIQLKQQGDYYTLPVLASTTTGSDGRFSLQNPPIGQFMVYAVSPSSEYWDWVGRGVTIISGQAVDVGELALSKKLQLISPPNGGVISTSTPTLQWASFPGIARYDVYVFNHATSQRVFLQSTQGTQIVVAPPLQIGQQYEWFVDAYDSAGRQIAYWSSWYFTVQAPPKTWTLQGVTFSDGGTASGWFTYDATTQQISSWNIAVSGGNTNLFPTFVYTPTLSSADRSSDGVSMRYGFGGPINPAFQRKRWLTFVFNAPLTNAGGSVGIAIDSPWVAECYSCDPYRRIVSGSVSGQ